MVALICRRWRAFKDDRGSELIELAIVLPILFLVFAAIIDFGFLFQRYEVVTNAAREGARMAVLPGYSTTDVQTRVQNYLTKSGLGIATTITATPGVEVIGATSVNVVTVQVVYPSPFTFIAPIAGMVGGSGWTALPLRSSSTMRCEAQSSTCPGVGPGGGGPGGGS
jgi:Flp pilus assembly protein TadG